MRDLKQQFLRDSTLVFHNPKGFAQKLEIVYQDRTVALWGVIDEEGTAVRDKNNNQRKNDNEKALYQHDRYVWVNQKDLGIIPKRGRTIVLNRVNYQIVNVTVEFGEIRMNCRRLVE